MQCAWDAFIHLLPAHFRSSVDMLGKDNLQEVRMRICMPPELVLNDRIIKMDSPITADDLKYCIQFASQYSPWSANTINHGYITAPGGHRVGVFGRYAHHSDNGWSLQTPAMLCLRVARDFERTIDRNLLTGSVLIIGPPGSGKTTLLRDLIRQYSNMEKGNISVIDEREEVFPRYRNKPCFNAGCRTDVLSGCYKHVGIEWALRNMTPSVIAVDEITAQIDCEAMLHAGWCGVNLFATAHAGNKQDLLSRPVYKPLIEHNLFQTLLVMHPDKSWHAERICI